MVKKVTVREVCEDAKVSMPHVPEFYTHREFDKLMESTFQNLLGLSEHKGGEYAGDFDRLANFRRNGKNLGVPMEIVWSVYAGKHWDAISQYVQDVNSGKQRFRMETIQGRIDDLMLYLLLFKAIYCEKNDIRDFGVLRDEANSNQAQGASITGLNRNGSDRR